MFKFNKKILERYRGSVFQKPKRGSKEGKEYYDRISFNTKAKEQIQLMAKNIQMNTPRIIAGLVIGISLPQCYNFYKSIWLDYDDKEYYQNLKQTVDWFNCKNAFCCASILALESVKFRDRKSKNTIPRFKTGTVLTLVPIMLGLISISTIQTTDKKMMLTTMFSDCSLLLIEAHLSNQGVIPFWYFNLRYQMHLFDLLLMTFMYFSMKNYKKDTELRPLKYKEMLN